MTPARFAALADAYGGDFERWPAGERSAARDHLRDHPAARAMLENAACLDMALAAWRVEGPGSALAGRICGRIAKPRIDTRLRLFLSGLGAAAALAGGLTAGAAFVALTAQAPMQAEADAISVLGAPLDLPAGQPGNAGRS